MTNTAKAKNHYVETRETADRTKPGSRWERTGPSTEEAIARAEFESRKGSGLVDVRLVRLDLVDDATPTTTVVVEAVRS